MEEVKVRSTKIEIELNQEKIRLYKFAYNEEITYWKKAAWVRVLNESEEKELTEFRYS